MCFFCSLGVEPVDKDVMKRPPRKAADKMITLSLLAQILGASMMIVAGTLYVFRREVSKCMTVRNSIFEMLYWFQFV